MGTKSNPGPVDCYAHAAPDEPIFILRAHDESAPFIIRMWAENYKHHKKRVNIFDEKSQRKYYEALKIASEMEEYYKQYNSGTTKEISK